jgi:RHS repeat-associated protein
LDGFLTTRTNLTNAADRTSYLYSSRGELLRVTLPDGRLIEYVHDPLGRRIAKKVEGTITEKYLWQGMTRLLAVYDGSDNLLMRFEYADDRVPMTLTTEGVTYYLAYDQVGSLSAVADSAGNVIKRIDYDSFGNIIADTNPTFEVPLGFAGGLHDRDTNFVRFGYRDYDPDVGRWTAKDPVFFAGGDTDLYGYVLNDPVNLVDKDGLLWEGITKFVTQFVAGKAVRPYIDKYVNDPAGQRIISAGISTAIATGITGAAWGGITGALATGPLAELGGPAGALVGGIGGTITGLATGLLYGTIFEIMGLGERLDQISKLDEPC